MPTLTPTEYARLDATAMAELVRRGEVSAAELLDAALARADAVAPVINAIAFRDDDRARRQAAGAGREGVFAGVPFLLKDMAQDWAGAPTTQGSRALAGAVAATDADYTRRAQAAGCVIFGKTTSPELALKGVTETRAYGPTRNPLDPSRTPGGSSGGAAAAVAAGVVPMAGANDGGGSIRIPAAACGLVGLKPSRGRTSLGPAVGEFWSGASVELVVSRSVRDTAAMLDVQAAGPYEPGRPFIIAPPAQPYGLAIAAGLEPHLRVGLCTAAPLGTTDPVIVAAVESAARFLEGQGCAVEPMAQPVPGEALASAYEHMYYGHVAASVRQLRAAGVDPDALEPETRLLAAAGEALSAGAFVESQLRWHDFTRALDAVFARFDVVLMPTLARLPARVGELSLPAWQQRLLDRLGLARGRPVEALGRGLAAVGFLARETRRQLAYTPFTQLANLTGRPAISLPWKLPAGAGFPVTGLQFIAPFGREDRLLRLAAALEAHAGPDGFSAGLPLRGPLPPASQAR